jgi:ribonuclease HI
MRLVVHVDGGARGNPGPAAVGVVVSTPEGEVLEEFAQTIGEATNNVAEYRGVLLGLERARALGATELRPLHAEALRALQEFDDWSIRSVRREQNARADELVNQALDAQTESDPPHGPF